MIRDDLQHALDCLDQHKFGAKRKDLIEKAKQNARDYMSTIKKLLPDQKDLYKIMYLLWMAEYEAHKNKDNKDLAKKFKNSATKMKCYIEEQISTIVYP